MIPESATEWYRLTCPRCARRWAVRYEVRSVIDDAGQIRSLYASHGLPCEAPARAQANCPYCGYTPVRAELLGGPPAGDVPERPAPKPHGQHAAPRRHGTLHAWRRYTFEAIISLDAVSASGGWTRPRPATRYLPQTRSLMVHLPSPEPPGTGEYLPAVITRRDEQPIRPGDNRITVTISVPDEEASEVFAPGRRFALWSGADVGHGTVLRRVFFD